MLLRQSINPLKGILIFSFYLGLSLLYTYPLICNFDSSIFGIKGWPEDTIGVIYGIWVYKYSIENNLDIGLNPFLSAPLGIDYSIAPRQPLLDWITGIITYFFSEITAYNLMMLLGISLVSTSTFYLARYFTKNTTASLFAGIVFGFSPNFILHTAVGHVFALQASWIPLYLLFLFKSFDKPKVAYAVLSGIFFSLTTLSSYYFGYFLLIITILAYLWRFIFFRVKREPIFNSMTIRFILILFLVVLVSVIPFSYKIFWTFFTTAKTDPVIAGFGYIRPFGDLFTYSARLYDYILPSEQNPIFGKAVSYLTENLLGGGRHYFERTAYIGFVPLLFSVVAWKGWLKGRIAENDSLRFSLIVVLIISSVVFSLAPRISLGFFNLPNLSYFMYKIAPMFRVYARFSFIAQLCISILAAFGLTLLLARIKRRYVKGIVLSLAVVLFFSESTIVPPLRNVSFERIPAVYKWLSNQKGDFIIACYPLRMHNEYILYQRIHKKRMLNGNPLAPDIGDKDFEEKLGLFGVRYILIYKDYYKKYSPEKLKILQGIKGLKFIEDFDYATVYEVIK